MADTTLSIAFQTDKPLAAYAPLAAQAEAYGFDAVTVYNDMLYQPAWLPLLEMATSVEVTIVGTSRNLGGEPGVDVATYLARHGLDVTVNSVARDADDVAGSLNAHVREIDADFLVMGAYGHSRLREFIVGGATRDMLERMTVPTVMAH